MGSIAGLFKNRGLGEYEEQFKQFGDQAGFSKSS
jgi:hypothetical protein